MHSHAERRFHQPLPEWVPEAARHYLAHTESGLTIRQLARLAGCHASTVLRQVRRYETRRDDPLVDAALRRLGDAHFQTGGPDKDKDCRHMTSIAPRPAPDDQAARTLNQEARRVLRRLCETGAVLAIAADMDKAVIVRDSAAGTGQRTAVVDAGIAQALALKDWIACARPGRISRYRITAAGRAELSRLLAEQENRARGFAEAQASFVPAPVGAPPPDEARAGRRVRYGVAESPLTLLARRREKDGSRFLPAELVTAGERLREDFELAQMGPRVTQNWESFLTAGARGAAPDRGGSGPAAARDRVAAALRDLGPGLADVALRCCCHLEGLEQAEKRMGWSARSGKIVLRIALQRLRRHYDETAGRHGPMIG